MCQNEIFLDNITRLATLTNPNLHFHLNRFMERNGPKINLNILSTKIDIFIILKIRTTE